MMKIAVWGTGQRARQIVWEIGIENIDMFIDNKPKQKTFFKKPVFLPNNVKKWHDLFIYVPSTYYAEVVPILENNNMKEDIHFKQHFGISEITYLDAERNLQCAMERVIKLVNKGGNKSICSWGSFWTVKMWGKFYYDFIKRYQNDVAVVCENPFLVPDDISDNLAVDALIVPIAGYGKINIKDISKKILLELKKTIVHEMGDATEELAEGIYLRKASIGRDSALYNAYALYRYMCAILKAYKYKIVIINGSDALERLYLAKLCTIKKIPYICTHPSVLPGTVSFDPGGDMGTSMPAVYYRAFKTLPISVQEKETAHEVCQYLRKKRLNRKTQPHNDAVEKIKERLIPGNPIIFCAAQCDDGACLIPYTEESRKYHSPMFKSSIESAVFLAEICKKNVWNLIYKSHPMYAKFDRIDLLPDNVIYVDDCDINDLIDISDVVVTIRSSTNYIALIRQRPVLMLGYTQTHGQGCTYEAFVQEDIEPQLKKAIAEGFTEEQQEAFIEHVARLLKYYLYDDMLPRELRYGLPLPEKLEDFFALGKKLQQLDTEMKAGAING